MTRIFNPQQFMKAGEVADLFRVDVSTARKWAKTGALPVAYTPGGHCRFPREDIEAIVSGVLRTDLTGHTVTVEVLPEGVCRAAGLPSSRAGEVAAVERSAGRFVKVAVTLDDVPDGSSLRDAARGIARTYGATFVGGAQ